MKRALSALVLVFAASVAPAQQSGIEQIGAQDAANAVEQVGQRSRDITAPPRTDAGPPPPQLTAPGETRGDRSARAPESSSRPADGRTGVVARVEGRDRCDAAEAEEQAANCDRVIETRSAEFVRPDPTILSPEQRLLVEQRLREPVMTRRTVARQVGTGDPQADDDATQEVASFVQRPTTPAPATERESGVPGVEAITSTAEAIAAIVLGTAPPPQ